MSSAHPGPQTSTVAQKTATLCDNKHICVHLCGDWASRGVGCERGEVKTPSKLLSWPTAKHGNTKHRRDDTEILSSVFTRSCSFLRDGLEMQPAGSSVTPYDVYFFGTWNGCKGSSYLLRLPLFLPWSFQVQLPASTWYVSQQFSCRLPQAG